MRIAADQQSVFWKMASMVTVGSIQTPLAPRFLTDTPIDYAVEQVRNLDYPGSVVGNVSLVCDSDNPVGWLDWQVFFESPPDDSEPESDEEPNVQAFMCPIPIGKIIGADVTYFDLVELFSETKYGFFFVHDGKEISGTVYYRDLFRLPGVGCLFMFMLELETAALRLCQQFPMECLAALSKARLETALQVFKNRYGDVNSLLRRDFLDCTTFIDKSTMINKCKLLVDFSATHLKALFKRAEKVRNACAHPSDEDSLAKILPSEKIGPFFHECFLLIESMRNVTPRE